MQLLHEKCFLYLPCLHIGFHKSVLIPNLKLLIGQESFHSRCDQQASSFSIFQELGRHAPQAQAQEYKITSSFQEYPHGLVYTLSSENPFPASQNDKQSSHVCKGGILSSDSKQCLWTVAKGFSTSNATNYLPICILDQLYLLKISVNSFKVLIHLGDCLGIQYLLVLKILYVRYNSNQICEINQLWILILFYLLSQI